MEQQCPDCKADWKMMAECLQGDTWVYKVPVCFIKGVLVKDESDRDTI